jgi:hypothetical protein
MPAYDATIFDPPAPLALVTVRSPTSRESVTKVSMLIDSGADVSLLPRAAIAHLIEQETGGDQFELEGFDGSRSLAPAVLLELHFLGRVFRGQFLIIDQSSGILGPNILNAIPLLLDDPNLTWSEHQ